MTKKKQAPKKKTVSRAEQRARLALREAGKPLTKQNIQTMMAKQGKTINPTKVYGKIK